jgi:hypothetical protein
MTSIDEVIHDVENTAPSAPPAHRRWWLVALAALVVIAIVAAVLAGGRRHAAEPVRRPVYLEPYHGLGMWVDVFDWAPSYQNKPAVVPVPVTAIDDMAAKGVRTIYLQAARMDDRAPDGLVDPDQLGAWLERAHDRGMYVVAWYLPKFSDLAGDLHRLVLAHDFTTPRGDRFDGLAVDIEETKEVPDPIERGRRLVELSTQLRARVGNDVALGANVLPAVLTEVVNPLFWPAFPWKQLRDLYDVWLPMSYWTLRKPESGYRDGYRYTSETVDRMRKLLDDPNAVVHPIGGVADAATPGELAGYLQALKDVHAIGGSVYDFHTMTPPLWNVLEAGVPS